MKSASLSFSKNEFVATEARLLVGRWAMTLSTSSVTGVSRVNKGIVIPAPPWRLLPRSLGPEYISTTVISEKSTYHQLREGGHAAESLGYINYPAGSDSINWKSGVGPRTPNREFNSAWMSKRVFALKRRGFNREELLFNGKRALKNRGQ